VSFHVSDLDQGKGPREVLSSIFLWPGTGRIVVSDVDGTVTSSDLLGHVLPAFGCDWSHPGLGSLYQQLEQRDAKFLYLTSRPIIEAQRTVRMLRRVPDLPEGPVITTPNLIIPALTRELLRRRPADFKIPALQQIAELFEGGRPFVAGFGNRMSDVEAYRAVGIPLTAIATFNKKHQVVDGRNQVLGTIRECVEKQIEVVTLSPGGVGEGE
jgi:phosphatidate phosphatase LPIN